MDLGRSDKFEQSEDKKIWLDSNSWIDSNILKLTFVFILEMKFVFCVDDERFWKKRSIVERSRRD